MRMARNAVVDLITLVVPSWYLCRQHAIADRKLQPMSQLSCFNIAHIKQAVWPYIVAYLHHDDPAQTSQAGRQNGTA